MDISSKLIASELLTKVKYGSGQGTLSPEGTFVELLAKVEEQGSSKEGSEKGLSDKELMEACQQLEAVFLNLLAQEMRKTVPKGGFFETSRAQELFTGMLDEELTKEAAKSGTSQLAEILYGQLKQTIPKPTEEEK